MTPRDEVSVIASDNEGENCEDEDEIEEKKQVNADVTDNRDEEQKEGQEED